MYHCLVFPILGNPNGRIFEAIPKDFEVSDENLYRLTAEVLTRYGDLLPFSGIVDIYLDSRTPEFQIAYTRSLDDVPATLELRNPPGNPDQQILPGL